MASTKTTTRREHVPGRKPGPAQCDEVARIWADVDDDGRKMILFVARTVAREHWLVPPNTPLIITDRVF